MASHIRLLPLIALAGCATTADLVQPPARTWAPSKIPDRILLTWSDAPSTTQSVTWRTDATVQRGLVEYALAQDGPRFPNTKTFHAQSTAFESDLGRATYHTATIRQLSPATKYVYRVGDGTNWSEWSHFTTASARPEPFSFIYFGDAQNDIKSLWSRVAREAFRDAPRAAFLLHAGDLVNQPNSDAEWGEWFYSAGWINRTIPSIATPGNHEYAQDQQLPPRRYLSRHWRRVFEFPTHGPKGLDETVYYVDYQGARIISLNSNRELAPQVAWFDAIMQECDAAWTIVTMHHPVFSTAAKRDNPELRATLQPLFDRHRVDLVLQGHDHTYGRTGLMRHGHDDPHEVESNVPSGVRAQAGESGTVYVVSVSGPKMYALDRKPFMVRATKNKQLYQVISIDGDRLSYSAYTATGKLFDHFELHKRDGQPNRLVEDG